MALRSSFFAQDVPVKKEVVKRPAIQRSCFDVYEQSAQSDFKTTTRRGSYYEREESLVRRPIVSYSEKDVIYEGCVFVDRKTGQFMWVDRKAGEYEDYNGLWDSLTTEEQQLILSGNIPTYQEFFNK